MLQEGQTIEINGQVFVVVTVEYYPIETMYDAPKVKHLQLLGLK